MSLSITEPKFAFFITENLNSLQGPLNSGWVARVVFLIQILLRFGGRCTHLYFLDIRLKINRSPNFHMLFQFL